MQCLDLGDGGDSPDLGYDGWYYQTCTEFVMPFCSDGKEDMFMVHKFDLNAYEGGITFLIVRANFCNS